MKTFVLGLFLMAGCFSFSQTQTGKASFYAEKFDGRPTASGETYKHNLATAAHRKLPFGTKVKVTNLENNKSAIVKINDRGPFIRGRIIDLSRSVAGTLDITDSGITDVRIEVLEGDPEILEETAENVSTPKKERPEAAEQNKSNKESISENFSKASKNTVEEREFYELTADEVKPDFYGLQIASFAESDNLIRLANRLKSSYKSKVLIEIKTMNETEIYKVILGQFQTRKEAEDFKSRNLDKYPGAFIVDMTRKD